MTERVARLRQCSLDTKPWLSLERAALLTEFYRDAGPLSPPVLRARALEYIMEHRSIYIGRDELIVGGLLAIVYSRCRQRISRVLWLLFTGAYLLWLAFDQGAFELFLSHLDYSITSDTTDFENLKISVAALADRVRSAASALVVLGLPMLAIAVLVKATSPGPVLYRRRVMGQGGRPFDALKFRTMHRHGDDILAAYPALREELRRAG